MSRLNDESASNLEKGTHVAIQDLASALTHRREGRTVHGHT